MGCNTGRSGKQDLGRKGKRCVGWVDYGEGETNEVVRDPLLGAGPLINMEAFCKEGRRSALDQGEQNPGDITFLGWAGGRSKACQAGWDAQKMSRVKGVF